VICAQPDAAGVITVTPTQPADLATCAMVLITGSELSAVTGIAFPSPADFGEVWAYGFTLVVGSYLIGWGAGAVLRFVRS
jgi:hypothetical protein